ncbi:MAG: helix-turn-helix domain-containing protein [Acidobacteriota bacterium]
MLRRASNLRRLDGGQRVAQVAENAGVAPKTVRAIARRYEEGGWIRLCTRSLVRARSGC